MIFARIAACTSSLLYALNSDLELFYTPSEIIHGKKDTGVKPKLGNVCVSVAW